MSEGVEEVFDLHPKNDNGLVDCGVSNDAAWQRRGFSSNNGFLTSISIDTGKILDVEAMSRICRGCEAHKKLEKENQAKYLQWKADHVCQKNHKRSTPVMESEGAVRVFSRSINKHRLRYMQFYGDGDSKSFAADENTYDINDKVVKYVSDMFKSAWVLVCEH